MEFKDFSELVKLVRGKPNRVVVPGAASAEVLEALKMSDEAGLLSGGALVGDKKEVEALAARVGLGLGRFQLFQETEVSRMCDLAAGLIKDGGGDFLVKGMVDTKSFLKSIMRRESGLVDEGAALSHVVLFQTARYHKLFALSDAAIMIAPSLEEKRLIVRNAVGVMRRLGVATPKVAVICPIEKVNPGIPSTEDAAALAAMSRDGRIGNAVVEGPYDLYIAFSRRLADEKGVKGGLVPGDADIAVLPDLDAANAVYKAISFFADGFASAAIVAGARLPVILPSRADEPRTKMLSIALASFMKGRTLPA